MIVGFEKIQLSGGIDQSGLDSFVLIMYKLWIITNGEYQTQ